MVRRATRFSRLDTAKSQPSQLQLIDEYINDSNRVVRAEVIVKTLRQ